MLLPWKKDKNKYRQVLVYSKRLHKNSTIEPPKEWWKTINGTVIDFWKYDEVAYVDIITKKTIVAPLKYKHKNRLRGIRRGWCKVKWVKH